MTVNLLLLRKSIGLDGHETKEAKPLSYIQDVIAQQSSEKIFKSNSTSVYSHAIVLGSIYGERIVFNMPQGTHLKGKYPITSCRKPRNKHVSMQYYDQQNRKYHVVSNRNGALLDIHHIDKLTIQGLIRNYITLETEDSQQSICFNFIAFTATKH